MTYIEAVIFSIRETVIHSFEDIGFNATFKTFLIKMKLFGAT